MYETSKYAKDTSDIINKLFPLQDIRRRKRNERLFFFGAKRLYNRRF